MKPHSFAKALLVSTLILQPAIATFQSFPVYAQDESLSGSLNLLKAEVLDDQGKNTDSWKKGEVRDLKLTFKSQKLKTEDIYGLKTPEELKDPISADLLNCGFTGSTDPEVTILSKEGELLKIEVLFKGLKWSGADNTLSYALNYANPQITSTTGSLAITACHNEEPEPEPTPEPTPEPEPEPDPEPDPGYSDYVPYEGGSAGGDDGSSISAPAPNLIIRKYTYGGDSVKAGSTFDLNIEFFNTSKSLTVENIVMQVETGEGLAIANSSNTYYFESVGPQAEKKQTIKIRAIGTDSTSSPSISVSFQYEYVDQNSRHERQNSEKIAIPVSQPDRFEISEPSLPEPMQAGVETVLSFPYVNKGKGTLYNVAVTVEGDMPVLQKVMNLGNFEPGKSGSIDAILEPDQAGEIPFKVIISYEDSDGKEVKKEFKYTAQVEEMEPMPSEIPEFPEEEEQSSNLNWLWIVLLLGAGAGIGGWFWWKKKGKGHKKDESVNDDTDWFEEEEKPETEPEESMEEPDSATSESPDEDFADPTDPDSEEKDV